jgi:hypothetical protein
MQPSKFAEVKLTKEDGSELGSRGNIVGDVGTSGYSQSS